MERNKGNLIQRLCYGAGDIYGGGSFLIFSMLYMNFLVLVEGLPSSWRAAGSRRRRT